LRESSHVRDAWVVDHESTGWVCGAPLLLLLRAADIGPLCLRLFRVHGDHVRLRESPLTTEDL